MGNVIVTVGRLDNNKRVSVEESKNIKAALAENGFNVQTGEKIQDVHGNEYTGNETVEGGCEYFLVQSVKSA